jgi:hypothetical protein
MLSCVSIDTYKNCEFVADMGLEKHDRNQETANN